MKHRLRGGRLEFDLLEAPEFAVFSVGGDEASWKKATISLLKMIAPAQLDGTALAKPYNSLVQTWKQGKYKWVAPRLRSFVARYLTMMRNAPKPKPIARTRVSCRIDGPNMLPSNIRPVNCSRGGTCVPTRQIDKKWVCGCKPPVQKSAPKKEKNRGKQNQNQGSEVTSGSRR